MSYNCYKNWTQWNVSLWINNDEALYNMAKGYYRRYHNKVKAAEAMLCELNALHITHTPDGAKYSVTAIRAAMVGM